MLPLQWLTRSIATSTAAWIGALPLTLYYFHLASPVALLANLIVIPLSSLALGSNLGALLVGWVSPGVAELLNHSAWFWMVCMVRVSEWAAALPWGYFYLPSLRWYDSVLFYGLLLGWVSGLFHRRWALACFGAGLVLVIGRVGLSLCTYEIIVFPHQAGTVIHCDGPGRGRDLLIDTGVNNLASTVTLPILRARGVNNVPRLLLSHGDARHIGAVELLLLELDPAKIIVGDAPSRSPIYRRVVKELESTPGKLSTVSRGHRIGLFTVLHPDAGDRFPRGDDNAVVLHGRVYGASILLLSDLGSAGQDALLSREPNLRADIIVTSLPANGEPICDELLDRLQPKTILVCDADFPAAERASHRLRQRLARRGIQVFYGSDQGSLRLNFTPWSGGAVKMQRGDLFQFLIP
jgi:beta-lactamase superfamily II metal-dependent hydrolase